METTLPASRDHYGRWLVEQGLTGLAIEVGVHRGAFAAALLREWPGLYVGVDPWRVLPEYNDRLDHSDSQSQAARDADYAEAVKAVTPYPGRALLVRRTSFDVAWALSPEIADFVYLDGNHEQAGIESDLCVWWPVVKQGGYLCGHDYTQWAHTVGKAVDEFAADNALQVAVLRQGCGEWILRKE